MKHYASILVSTQNAVFLRSVLAFSLLEVLLALSVFSIAAISLAAALNSVGLTVADSQDDGAVREQLRSLLVEKSRLADLQQLEEETLPDQQNIIYKILVERLEMNNIDGESLENLYQITVTAVRSVPGLPDEVIDSAQTYSYPDLFR